jgi:hypothetical protein
MTDSRMRRFILSVACVLSFACAAAAQDTAAIKSIQDDVSNLLLAVQKQDSKTILDLTHPRVFEISGGRDKLEAALVMVFKQWQDAGMAFKSVEFPAPPTFHKGTESEYVVVPTHTVVTVSGKTIDARGFQLGARKIGESKWGFVDGAKLSKEVLALLFPDFPKDIALPEKTNKVGDDKTGA